jgi:hypothetical protein
VRHHLCRSGGKFHRVVKSILISRMEAAMHAKELHVAAALSEAEALREELKRFNGTSPRRVPTRGRRGQASTTISY